MCWSPKTRDVADVLVERWLAADVERDQPRTLSFGSVLIQGRRWRRRRRYRCALGGLIVRWGRRLGVGLRLLVIDIAVYGKSQPAKSDEDEQGGQPPRGAVVRL